MSPPMNTPGDDPTVSVPANRYVLLNREQVIRLLQLLPDCESAIILAIAALATENQQAVDGRFAGRAVAELTGPELAKLIGRPLRSVRHALSVLKAARVIQNLRGWKGPGGIYTVPSMAAEEEGGADIQRPKRGGRWAKRD